MAKFKGVWCRNCGCEMKLREGKYGKFYGCTGYPKCLRTLSLRDAAREEEVEDDEKVGYDDPQNDDKDL